MPSGIARNKRILREIDTAHTDIKIDAHERWVAPQRMATQTRLFSLFLLATDATTTLYTLSPVSVRIPAYM
jgi:hypothetical protein